MVLMLLARETHLENYYNWSIYRIVSDIFKTLSRFPKLSKFGGKHLLVKI